MRKRLRKKLHKNEFTQYGCEIEFDLNDYITEKEKDKIYDEFIDFIEENGYDFGGGCNEKNVANGFVSYGTDYRKSPKRDKFIEWFSTKNITNFKVGDLVDANSPKFYEDSEDIDYIRSNLILDGKTIIKVKI